MSICPRELQAMLHVCQQWSMRNRMQIYTGKKTMAFFETPALLHARGDNISPAQPCPLFTCNHPSQSQTLARTLSTKSPNLSTFALFWILNSLCTSLLSRPYDVLPRVKPLR